MVSKYANVIASICESLTGCLQKRFGGCFIHIGFVFKEKKHLGRE